MDEDTLEATIDTLSIAKRIGSYLETHASTDELKQIGQTVVSRAEKLSEKLQAKRIPQGTEEIPHIEVSNITPTGKQNLNSVITHVMPPQPSSVASPIPRQSKKQRPPTMDENYAVSLVPNIDIPPNVDFNTFYKTAFAPKKSAKSSNTRKLKLQKGLRNIISHNTGTTTGQKTNAASYYSAAAAAGGARRRTHRRR